MLWFDLDEELYAGTLPPSETEARRKVRAENQDFSGFEVCRNFETARAMLEYSNQKLPRNELIAVRSRIFSEIKGDFDFLDREIDWVGFDIVSVGHWSLLKDGLFAAPSYFSRWASHLNKQGVFEDSSITEEYVNDYHLAGEKCGVEPLPPSVYGIDAVEVGRIHI